MPDVLLDFVNRSVSSTTTAGMFIAPAALFMRCRKMELLVQNTHAVLGHLKWETFSLCFPRNAVASAVVSGDS